MNKEKKEINAILLVNKEKCISSNSVANKVKYILNASKAGHLGTLDVLGEGLLPVTLGKATKLFDMFLNKDKVYRTIFKFGLTTDTLDLEGEITNRNEVEVTEEMIRAVIPEFVGKQNQMPPKYSAKKIKGDTAYTLARKGIEFELKPKEIEIYSLKLIKQTDYNTFEFEVHCSSGTYIRSLCRDIAERLSTYGVMSYIQRTKCGDFSISDSYTLEEIKDNKFTLIKPEDLFDMPIKIFDDDEAQRLLNGGEVKINMQDCQIKGFKGSTFLGVCQVENQKAKIKLRLV